MAILVTAGTGKAKAQAIEQKPGIDGALDAPIRIGDTNPLQFRLKGIWCDVMPFGSTDPQLRGDEKMLIFDFTVQNASTKDQPFRNNVLKFFAVDDKGETHAWQYGLKLSVGSPVGKVSVQDLIAELLATTLKQAQTISCRASIRVPADRQIMKLIVERVGQNKAKVIRYDLASKVVPLPLSAPFVGAEPHMAKEIVDADWSKPKNDASDKWYPLNTFLLRMEGFERIEPHVVGQPPNKTDAFYVATFTVRNVSTRDQSVSNSGPFSVASRLYCGSGEYFPARGQFHSIRPERLPSRRYQSDETVTLRMLFRVPLTEPSAPAFVELGQGSVGGGQSRKYRFRVG